MSKASYSPLGQWRGRTGGQVYRVRGGVQVISAYQPAVANPKSDAQMLQRAKFNLMTKLNALFDARLLNGFGSRKGIARAAFSKKLMPKIYAQQIAGPDEIKYRANIAPADIVFGPNNENYLNESATIASHIQLAAAGTVARLTFTTLEGLFDVDPQIARIRFIDVYGSSVFDYSEVKCYDINGTQIDSVPASLDFEGAGEHRMYMQVLMPNNDALNNFHGGAVTNDPNATNEVSAESGASYASAYKVGGSIYIGSVTVTV